MIPDFDTSGNLPIGIHQTTWKEFVDRFSHNTHREHLITGLEAVIDCLKKAGCKKIYIDGSFVTIKIHPGDIDIVWDTSNVDIRLLLEIEPLFGIFSNKRSAQKAKYGCEFFPSTSQANNEGDTFLEFFQIDKESGSPKGIIVLYL